MLKKGLVIGAVFILLLVSIPVTIGDDKISDDKDEVNNVLPEGSKHIVFLKVNNWAATHSQIGGHIKIR